MNILVPSRPPSLWPDERRLALFFLLLASSLLALAAILGKLDSQIESLHWWLSSILFLSFAIPAFGSKEPSEPALPQRPEIALQAQAWREMADPALVCDQYGTILACNEALEAMLGQSAGDLLGGKLAAIWGNETEAQTQSQWLLDTLGAQGRLRGFEISISAPKRGSYSLEANATALNKGNGRSYSVVWRDVTERSRQERALQLRERNLGAQYVKQTQELAQKVEALARANEELQEIDKLRMDLISLVSHQVRAPLTNMIGAVESMQSGCASPTEVCHRMFVVMRDQMDRLKRLVGDILSVTRLESGDEALQTEPISLMSILEKVTEQMRARGHRNFDLPYRPVLPLVMADRDRLSEVMVNLLDNADKYSPPGKDVRIEIRPTETKVIISVLDNGPGLPTQDLERIFEKFYRAEAGDSQRAYGYGLGLYICRLLVEAHGGHIWAANRPSGGASFSFSLPVANI